MHDDVAHIMTVRQVVLEVICEILPDVPKWEIAEELKLGDLGADSTEQVEIIMALKDRLSNNMPLSSFMQVNNIGGLISYLSQHANG